MMYFIRGNSEQKSEALVTGCFQSPCRVGSLLLHDVPVFCEKARGGEAEEKPHKTLLEANTGVSW